MGSPGQRTNDDVVLRFAERLTSVAPVDMTRRLAQPTGIADEPAPNAARGRGARAQADPLVREAALSGSSTKPTLQIIGRAPAGVTWATFAVDTSGRIDMASAMLPPGSDDAVRASVLSVLPRLRFSSAVEKGRPVCELVRLEVNLTAR